MLLAAGAMVNAAIGSGRTLLMMAYGAGHVVTAQVPDATELHVSFIHLHRIYFPCSLEQSLKHGVAATHYTFHSVPCLGLSKYGSLRPSAGKKKELCLSVR